MAERPTSPSAQETTPLNEQGGLTPEHWQFIKEKLPKKYKINQFARAVLTGIVDPEDTNQYLGKRHWDELWNYFFRHTGGFIPELTVGYNSRYTKLADEIKKYASQKRDSIEPTIDDRLVNAIESSTPVGYPYLFVIGGWYSGEPRTGWYWSRLRRNWFNRSITKEWEVVDSNGGGISDQDPGSSHTEYKYGIEWLGKDLFDASGIAKRFLLDPNTDFRILKKSPRALVRIAESQPEAVARRTGLNWEKPIPRVA